MNRAKWFKVHSWVGFKLSILLCFVLITGTLAVLSNEIDWLTNPAKRVDPATVQNTDWLAVYSGVKQQLHDKDILYIEAPIDPWFSVNVAYYENEKQLHRLFFHPTTGEYLGDGRWYNWQRFFRMTHRHLMMPTIIGITVVGLLGVLMMISLITSLVVYRKWWTGFFRIPRTSHRKVFWGDIHRLLGVWSMWFVLVIGLTGVWYLVEKWGLNAKYPSRGTVVTEAADKYAIMPSVAAFSSMLQTLSADYPQLKLAHISFPQRGGQPVSFQGQADAILVRPRANMISFDPVSAERVALNKGEDLSVHGRISEAADPLHFGTFGGLTTKILYFVFGIILSALAVTGTYIYGMRVARMDKSETKPRRKIWSAAGKDMRWGKWFSYLGLIICFAITIYVFGGWASA